MGLAGPSDLHGFHSGLSEQVGADFLPEALGTIEDAA